MLLYVAKELAHEPMHVRSSSTNLLSVPVEDRKSIKNTILIAKSLHKSDFSKAHNFKTCSR